MLGAKHIQNFGAILKRGSDIMICVLLAGHEVEEHATEVDHRVPVTSIMNEVRLNL